MMGRKIRTKVPMFIPPSTSSNHQEAQQNDAVARQKQKEYADRHRRARQQEVKIGDKVLLWRKKTTTKQPYDPDPYKVTQIVGTQVTGERRGKQRIRNIERWEVVRPRPDHWIPDRRRSIQKTCGVQQDSSDSEPDFEIAHKDRQEPGEEQQRHVGVGDHNEEEVVIMNEQQERRPVRERRQPERYGVQVQQQRPAASSPRERKRRQAEAAKRATPRREQRKQERQIQ